MSKKVYWPQFRKDQWISVGLVLVAICVYHWRVNIPTTLPLTRESKQFFFVPEELEPTLKHDAQDAPVITASSAAVIDIATAMPLYEKQSRISYLPASTTKLMTALVALEQFSPDTIVTAVDPRTVDGAKIGLGFGQQFSVRNLLKAMLIQSGNDAAIACARSFPGGEQAFVSRMNAKASELHLDQTIFENPTGYDGVHHQTTAFDLSILSREVLKDPLLKEIVRSKTDLITDVSRKSEYFLVNTHQLIGTDPSITGVKTGTTDGAGQVLITSVEKEGRKIIIVVMDSADRYKDTLALIDWVFLNYLWEGEPQVVSNGILQYDTP